MAADAMQLRWPWPRPVRILTPEPPPPSPDTQIAELKSQFETFKATQEQQISGLQQQLEIERAERRQVEIKNTDLGKELSIQKGYNDMLKGNLEMVNTAASALANDMSAMRTLVNQADERLKWHADTIDGLKHRITQLEELLSAKDNEVARVTQRLTVVELQNELLVEENAEIRAAAGVAGVDLREIELRIHDRRNQVAQRKREAAETNGPEA